MRALTVTHAFGSYEVGEIIADKDAMKAALGSNPAHVVRVNLPDEAEKPAKADKSKPTTDASDTAPTPAAAS